MKKRIWKELLALLTCGMLACGAAACGETGGLSSTSGTDSSEISSSQNIDSSKNSEESSSSTTSSSEESSSSTTSSSEKTTRMAFSLWNRCCFDSDEDSANRKASRYYNPSEIFSCGYAPYFYEGIKIRYPEYTRENHYEFEL